MARERKFTDEELYNAVKSILLEQGYEGFTFSLLADRLEVSRGAIYKYYENKESLITQYMVYEMDQFIKELERIHQFEGFEQQFDVLMEIIFNKQEVHQLIAIAQHIINHNDEKLKEYKEKLEKLPLQMYLQLQTFIQVGKSSGKLKKTIPDSLMIGFILQSIAIPNHTRIPQSEWITYIKEMISQGLFTHS
ncbi:TetR/AcrR family transcriptional regulator [Bacillus sp. BGMRC 2118]|nr:TetR/AcrR family transcriptional regulator [Bacillus sp. BGMRC 2118]